MPAGNYEFPFEIILEGSLSETVEGLPDNWVIYRFKAEIGRKYAKDIIVRKPLRIIRTLESTALELSHAMVRETLGIPEPSHGLSLTMATFIVRGKYLA